MKKELKKALQRAEQAMLSDNNCSKKAGAKAFCRELSNSNLLSYKKAEFIFWNFVYSIEGNYPLKLIFGKEGSRLDQKITFGRPPRVKKFIF